LFESWAEGLSPDLFERLVIAPTKMIIDRVRAAGIDKPIMGFPRGAGLNALRYARATGITAIAAGTDTPMDKFRKRLPDNMPYQGNLDPLALRIGGDVLRRAVQTVLETTTGPHIFNLGHGVTPDVKIANVQAVVNHIRTGDGDYVEAKMIEAAEKLMKIIMNPAMIVMFILGLILVFGYNAANLTSSIWLPVKLVS